MPGFKFLRYQLRYQNGADPESLISKDVADALRQAKEKSYLVQSAVFLWCEGSLVAECTIPSEKNEALVSDAIMRQLVETGFYVMADRLVEAGIHQVSPMMCVERQEDS